MRGYPLAFLGGVWRWHVWGIVERLQGASPLQGTLLREVPASSPSHTPVHGDLIALSQSMSPAEPYARPTLMPKCEQRRSRHSCFHVLSNEMQADHERWKGRRRRDETRRQAISEHAPTPINSLSFLVLLAWGTLGWTELSWFFLLDGASCG